MKYYKVKREAHDWFTGNTAIKNELVTAREKNIKFRYLDDSIFEPVQISKNKIFWSFGCRFEIKEEKQ